MMTLSIAVDASTPSCTPVTTASCPDRQGDEIVLLRPSSGQPPTKSFQRGKDGRVEKQDYPPATYYRATVVPISDIESLGRALEVGGQQGQLAIRGAIRPGIDLNKPVRRRKTGQDAAFMEAPRCWICLDIDRVPCPPTVDPRQVKEVIEYLRGLLPEEFRDATCFYQLSASFMTEGLLGTGTPGTTLKAHLFFWLDQAYSHAELKCWAGQVNQEAGFKLIDTALFQAVQPIYITPPRFIDLPDPVPDRFGFLYGEVDEVALVVPAKPALDQHPAAPAAGSSPGLGFEGWLARVGDQPGREGFNGPLLRAAGAYVASHGNETTLASLDDAKAQMRAAIHAAHKASDRPASTIERYLSETYLNALFLSAIAKGFGHRASTASTADVASAAAIDCSRLFIPDLDPAYPCAPLPFDTASQCLDNVLSEFIKSADNRLAPKRMAVEGAAGLGKSTRISELIAKKRAADRTFTVEYYVPGGAQMMEAVKRFHRLGITARPIRGRLQNDERHMPLCSRREVVKALQEKGVTYIGPLLCESWFKDILVSTCPFRYQCGYYRQFKLAKNVAVRVLPHSYLPKSRGRWEPAEPDLVVIDESPLDHLWEEAHWSVSEILEYSGVLAELTRLLIELAGRDVPDQRVRTLIEALQVCYPTARQELDALEAEWGGGEVPVIDPSMDNMTLLRKIEHFTPDRKPRALIRGLREAFQGHEAISLWYTPHGQGGNPEASGCLHMVRRLVPIRARQQSMVLLDATMDITLLRKVFPHLEHHVIRVERQAHVIQVYDTALSDTRLRHNRRHLRERIQRWIQRLAAFHGPGLVIGPKFWIPTLKAALSEAGLGPDDVLFAHYGALRGLNSMAHCRWVVLVGRQQMPPHAAEQLARAFYADEATPLTLTGQYDYRPAGYRMRDGRRLGVAAHYHPDERIDRLLRSRREDEATQALDRIRAVRAQASSPKHMFILTHLPLDVTVDELVSLDSLLGDLKLVEALTRHGEVLPLKPQWLAAAMPDLWPSLKAAERWIAEVIPPNPNKTLLETGGITFFQGQFKPPGQRGPRPTRFVTTLRNLDRVQARLERQLGMSTGPIAWLGANPPELPVPMESVLSTPAESTDVPTPPELWGELVFVDDRVSSAPEHSHKALTAAREPNDVREAEQAEQSVWCYAPEVSVDGQQSGDRVYRVTLVDGTSMHVLTPQPLDEAAMWYAMENQFGTNRLAQVRPLAQNTPPS